MDNQHKRIKGYRDLSQEEIDLMNRIKAKGEELNALCDEIQKNVSSQHTIAIRDNNDDELERLHIASPHKWLATAEHDLQTGIMKLVRAVAQPSTF